MGKILGLIVNILGVGGDKEMILKLWAYFQTVRSYLKGKKTVIVGSLMVVHALSTLSLEYLSHHPFDKLSEIELGQGVGLITLRMGVNN